MNNNHSSQSSVGVDFAYLFSGEGEISLERVEAFLDRVIKMASDQAKISPHQLVRVIHNGKVTWMTQKQALEFLQKSKDIEMQSEVQRALKGELKFIRQELEILLAIANFTLRQYKKNQALNQKEIERIEPSLQRRQRELNEGVTSSIESETIVKEKRRKNPLLDQYESMMGEFLEEKNQGNLARAAQLAKELAAKKRQYILLTRSIEPDIQTIYYHRLNLQKTKKRILNSQNDLCASRKDRLQVELHELKNNFKEVQAVIQEAEKSGLDSAAKQIEKDQYYDLSQTKNQIQECEGELNALEKEQTIIEQQEKNVESVIQHISENVLQETDTQLNIDEMKKHTPKPPQKQTPASQEAAEEKRKSGGMHFKRS